MDISGGDGEEPVVKVKSLPVSIERVGGMCVSGQRGVVCVNSYAFKGDVGKVRKLQFLLIFYADLCEEYL